MNNNPSLLKVSAAIVDDFEKIVRLVFWMDDKEGKHLVLRADKFERMESSVYSR